MLNLIIFDGYFVLNFLTDKNVTFSTGKVGIVEMKIISVGIGLDYISGDIGQYGGCLHFGIREEEENVFLKDIINKSFGQ